MSAAVEGRLVEREGEGCNQRTLERRWWSSGARQTAKDSSGVRGAAAEKKCSISAPIDSLYGSGVACQG